jgi:hypothetical protein
LSSVSTFVSSMAGTLEQDKVGAAVP